MTTLITTHEEQERKVLRVAFCAFMLGFILGAVLVCGTSEKGNSVHLDFNCNMFTLKALNMSKCTSEIYIPTINQTIIVSHNSDVRLGVSQ